MTRRTATRKVANRTGRDFGWAVSFSRRPPISLHRIVTHTEGYTYAAKAWALSIVHLRFLSPNPYLRFATFLPPCVSGVAGESHDADRGAGAQHG
jgi:hypothetical protein